MKKVLALIVLLLFVHAGAQAVPKYVQAQLFYSKFLSPTDGPYLETYLSIIGNSVEYVDTGDGKFQGQIEITMVFSRDGEVVNFDKYELKSPLIEDTTNITMDFLDQQRFSLPNGVYEYQIKIRDLNSDTPPFSTSQTIEMDFPADEVSVSGIQLVESFEKTSEPNILTKSGYDLVPYVYNFIPDRVNSLSFYSEVYNTDKVLGTEETFLINYFIQTYETSKKLERFVGFKRETSAPVNILFANFDLTNLPSGNYFLVVEVRNRENEIVAENRLFFQRSNPDVKMDYSEFTSITVDNSFVSQITDPDTLREYIHSLEPISTDIEKNFVKYQIDKGDPNDLAMMQRYFLNFWLTRDDLNPEHAWKQYLSAVELVNEQFGYPGKGGQKGYESDMGRIYLKYGPPNTIVDRPFDASTSGLTINDDGGSGFESGSVPYQIWHYYSLDNYRNRKFVFANKHLAASNYELIHSNMPGEISNENWQSELHWRFRNNANMPGRDKYGGKSGDLYNNPR